MSPSHREMQQVNPWATPYQQKRVEVKHHCSTHLIAYSLWKIDYIRTPICQLRVMNKNFDLKLIEERRIRANTDRKI